VGASINPPVPPWYRTAALSNWPELLAPSAAPIRGARQQTNAARRPRRLTLETPRQSRDFRQMSVEDLLVVFQLMVLRTP